MDDNNQNAMDKASGNRPTDQAGPLTGDNRSEPDRALEHLHKAEHDLEKAVEKEREAEQEIGKAEAEIKEALHEVEHAREFPIEVLYDGVKKPFVVRIEEAVKRLLDQAIGAFGPLPNPHMLALYKAGKELADGETLKQAGVKPHDVLLLRPSTVKGGA